MTMTQEEIAQIFNDFAIASQELAEAMREAVIITTNTSKQINSLSNVALKVDHYFGRRGIYHKNGRRIE